MIGIISCSKNKYKANNIEARKLYWKSTLFRLSYKVLRKKYPDIQIYILSAKYGLIKDTDIVSYYNKTLKNFTKNELKEFKDKTVIPDSYVFIVSSIYKSVLKIPPFEEIGKGLSLYYKLKLLKSLL